MSLRFHPILGSAARDPDGAVREVYTRTVVLWAVGITLEQAIVQSHTYTKSDVSLCSTPTASGRPLTYAT